MWRKGREAMVEWSPLFHEMKRNGANETAAINQAKQTKQFNNQFNFIE